MRTAANGFPSDPANSKGENQMGRHTGNRQVVEQLQKALQAFLDDHRSHAVPQLNDRALSFLERTFVLTESLPDLPFAQRAPI